MWNVIEDSFDPKKQHHKETIFTIGNGYLSTRGAFEEGYLGDSRATFIHGVFDDVPLVVTELANAPDWLPIHGFLNGERFSLDTGTVEKFGRQLALRAGVLSRTVRWRSPAGNRATLKFERFASLNDQHVLCIRCQVTPEFDGEMEIRASLAGNMNNDGFNHWDWVSQGERNSIYYLHNRTRATGIDVALAMRLNSTPIASSTEYWDAQNVPTVRMTFSAKKGETISIEKFVGIVTSRDTQDVVGRAMEHVTKTGNWESEYHANQQAWNREWERCDIEIDGDDEAQLAIRFNLFQMLIAAPRHDNRVNIGAKTLSGFGYRGHSFWDTEIFMLPLFIYTAPEIARNLLDYRYYRLPGARRKAPCPIWGRRPRRR